MKTLGTKDIFVLHLPKAANFFIKTFEPLSGHRYVNKDNSCPRKKVDPRHDHGDL